MRQHVSEIEPHPCDDDELRDFYITSWREYRADFDLYINVGTRRCAAALSSGDLQTMKATLEQGAKPLDPASIESVLDSVEPWVRRLREVTAEESNQPYRRPDAKAPPKNPPDETVGVTFQDLLQAGDSDYREDLVSLIARSNWPETQQAIYQAPSQGRSHAAYAQRAYNAVSQVYHDWLTRAADAADETLYHETIAQMTLRNWRGDFFLLIAGVLSGFDKNATSLEHSSNPATQRYTSVAEERLGSHALDPIYSQAARDQLDVYTAAARELAERARTYDAS